MRARFLDVSFTDSFIKKTTKQHSSNPIYENNVANMFGSSSTTTTANTSTSSGGFLSRLRSSNRPVGTKGPVYNTSSRSNRTTAAPGITRPKKTVRQKKTVSTGPAPMSHHRTKPTISQKIHGAAKVASGKMHNDHREVREGESKLWMLK